MTVGDWSDTTDFWTGSPPILISAIKCNTMFLNCWRLYVGMERFHEAQYPDYFEYTYSGAGGYWYYSLRITDDCPWDRLTIIEKVMCPNDLGTGNLKLTVQHVGAGTMLDTLLDCEDYTDYTWVKIIDAYDITGWAAGNHVVSVYWWPQGTSGCDAVRVKCRHAMLEASLV